MKTIKSTVIVLIAILTISLSADAQEKQINIEKSNVEWKGYKVTGSHNGTIAIKSGSLTFKDDKLTNGDFVIDMVSINTTDLQGEYKGKLDDHLKSDDFFGVEKHPTAILEFIKVKRIGKNSYKVKADLTIKGITKKVDVSISVYGNKAMATLKIDRTEFGVRYSSASFFENLKDKVIYDEFDLVVDLEF
ncbi:MAG: YceI family protein [Flavobacteriaceae bacterium]|nr:YceI family protein [Flavobacteriaceae bacterium]